MGGGQCSAVFVYMDIMKKRIIKAAAVWLIVGAAGLLYALVITKFRLPAIPCIVHLITGLKCPGCGNTTAVLALLRLDFAAAIHANLMALPELAFIMWAALSYTLVYIVSGKKQLSPKPEWLNWAFLFLLTVWTVARNIIGI